MILMSKLSAVRLRAANAYGRADSAYGRAAIAH